MKFRNLLAALTLIVTCAGCHVALADPAPSFPPDISTTEVGTATDHGTYLWEWDVFAGQKPALSHFVLIDLCDEVYEDIVPDSLYGGLSYEFGHDPTTNTDGLKFEVDLDDLEHQRFGFETSTQWEPGLLDVAFKSGQNVTFQDNVVGPHCDDDRTIPQPTPEPATMSLLGVGTLGMIARARKRRQA